MHLTDDRNVRGFPDNDRQSFKMVNFPVSTNHLVCTLSLFYDLGNFLGGGREEIGCK